MLNFTSPYSPIVDHAEILPSVLSTAFLAAGSYDGSGFGASDLSGFGASDLSGFGASDFPGAASDEPGVA